jgi:hypothetical protein
MTSEQGGRVGETSGLFSRLYGDLSSHHRQWDIVIPLLRDSKPGLWSAMCEAEEEAVARSLRYIESGEDADLFSFCESMEVCEVAWTALLS